MECCSASTPAYHHDHKLRFIVENKVTWLEATIACPIFTGLITYYIEGNPNERGHLMEETLGTPQRSIGVRGNCFSFLLPWENVMSLLSKAFAEGDFRTWPLDQETAAQIVRVKFVRGHEALRQQFKELKVRSLIVKGMANLSSAFGQQPPPRLAMGMAMGMAMGWEWRWDGRRKSLNINGVGNGDPHRH